MIDLAQPRTRSVILDLFADASAAAPGDMALARRYAQACTNAGDDRHAVMAWRNILAIDPDDAQAWAKAAAYLWLTGRAAEALDAAQRAVALEPGNANYLGVLGYALHVAGEDDAADRAYAQAFALDPFDGLAARGIGQAMIRRRAGSDLEAHCLQSFERLGSRGWIVSQYCVSLALLGRTAELHRLLDYDALLRHQTIDVPVGFASLDAFNAALSAEFHALKPVASGEIALDVIRNGLRVKGGPQAAVAAYGRTGAPASAALLDTFAKARSAYEHWVSAGGNTLLMRMQPKSTSLSTDGLITGRQAFVAPHMHGSAWISAVYYVKIPVEAPESGTAGCLEFAPPLHKVDLPDGIWPTRLVRPYPGLLIVFPGYAYHHVHANVATDERIAVSFDVQPDAHEGRAGVSGATCLTGLDQE